MGEGGCTAPLHAQGMGGPGRHSLASVRCGPTAASSLHRARPDRQSWPQCWPAVRPAGREGGVCEPRGLWREGGTGFPIPAVPAAHTTLPTHPGRAHSLHPPVRPASPAPASAHALVQRAPCPGNSRYQSQVSRYTNGDMDIWLLHLPSAHSPAQVSPQLSDAPRGLLALRLKPFSDEGPVLRQRHVLPALGRG